MASTDSSESRITRLPSGLRVATQRNSFLPGPATVGAWIDAGSAYENEDNNGASSMIQHVAWKGSARDAEKLGASMSSYTSREATAFYAQTSQPDNVYKVLPILADAVQNPSYDEGQVDQARQAVLKQAHTMRGQIEDTLYDHAHSAGYQGHGLAQSVVGEPKALKRLKASDLSNFASKHFTAPRTVIVGVGVEHDKFVSEVDKAFASLPKANPPAHEHYVSWIGSDIKIRDDTTHYVNTIVAHEAVSWTSPHYWSFLVLQALIGTWDKSRGGSSYLSSRLAEVAHSDRLGYSFQAFFSAYRNTGIFGVHAVGREDNIDDFVYQIFTEYQRINTYLSEQELTRAKAKVKLALSSQVRGPLSTATDLGHSVLFNNRHVSLAEAIARIDAVDRSDISSALRTYFEDVDPVVVAHGPLEMFPDYAYCSNWTHWNRW